MDGFKNTTRMKYMDEGISTRPTTDGGRRATDADLGIAPGGQSPKKAKPVGPASAAVSKVLAGMAKKALPAGGIGGAAAGAAAGALAGAAARAAKAIPRGMGAMSDREMQMLKAERKAMPTGAGAMSDRDMQMAKKTVPAYSDKPMIRRGKGGLAVMPKGKC